MIKSMASVSDSLSSNPASSLPACGQVLDLSASASSTVNQRRKIYITRALCRLGGTTRHSAWHMVTVRRGLALSLLFKCPGAQVGGPAASLPGFFKGLWEPEDPGVSAPRPGLWLRTQGPSSLFMVWGVQDSSSHTHRAGFRGLT